MKAENTLAETRSSLRRIATNTAWLLGGKGFGALCGIAYLAILTRSLGVKDFG
ncbi:MAG: lipopolysaccharide biosynthesis protein, partial [Novosphingobium sp.]